MSEREREEGGYIPVQVVSVLSEDVNETVIVGLTASQTERERGWHQREERTHLMAVG